MQRVAIARALINDPDILLADEPTGALDSETSVQVMEILKEVARDRLVIMVTHNPELAERYSTRIIRLLDGSVVDDTQPCTADGGSCFAGLGRQAAMRCFCCWGTCCSSAYITGKHCRSCCRWPVRGCSALCSGPGAGKSAAMHKSKTDKCRRTCKYAKHSMW